MRGCVLEAWRRRIEHNHLVALLDHALPLLFELFFLIKHQLTLHDVKLCIRRHGLDIISILTVHLLASLEVAGLGLRSKGQSYFSRTEDAKSHRIVLSTNSSHVRHLSIV